MMTMYLVLVLDALGCSGLMEAAWVGGSATGSFLEDGFLIVEMVGMQYLLLLGFVAGLVSCVC